MPTYELTLLVKTLPRNQLTDALKRATSHIFGEGGIIRKINHLGHCTMPYKMSVHGKVHKEAHYFNVEFDCPTFSVATLQQAYKLDSDIVRARFYEPVKPINPSQCTIEIETKPAPFRPEVQYMLRAAAKKEMRRKKLEPNTDLDFDPFPS